MRRRPSYKPRRRYALRKKRPSFTRRFRKSYRRPSIKRPKFFFKRTMVATMAIKDKYNVGSDVITTGSSGSSYDWSLTNVPNYSEFNNMFDFYKICGIKVKFIFDKNSIDVGTTGSNQTIPELVTWSDYNTLTAPSTLASILDKPSMKVKPLTRPITRYFKPKAYMDSSSSEMNIPVIQSFWNHWFNTASTGNLDETIVPHIGLKYSVDASMGGGTGTNTIGHLRVYTTFYLAFKSAN